MTRELQKIGKCAYSCIVDMVKALDVDYDRLSEVRERLEEIYDTLTDEELDDEEREELESEHEELTEELAELDEQAGDCESTDDAEQRIQEDPLSLEVRTDWHSPGDDSSATEYRLLLGTGGPAVRIIGTLGQYGEPDSAELQAQNWGTPWETYEGADEDILLQYASRFYYGE